MKKKKYFATCMQHILSCTCCTWLTNNRITFFNFTDSLQCYSSAQFGSSLVALVIRKLHNHRYKSNDQSDPSTHMSLLEIQHKVPLLPVLDHATFLEQETLKLNMPLSFLSPNNLLLHATYCACSGTDLEIENRSALNPVVVRE